MLCFYDLSEVPAIVFPAISQNFRNEVAPPSSEREVCVVQLSHLVFPVCASSLNLAHLPPKPVIWMEPGRFCGIWTPSFGLETFWILLVGWLIFFSLGLSFALYCFLMSCPLSQDSSRDMKWQVLFWTMIPSPVNRLPACEEWCGAIDMSAGHVALHTRQPHVSSPLFCCRFSFHFYCVLNFIFIFMGPWMKPELLCFWEENPKKKS